MATVAVTDDTFESEVTNAGAPVLVYFWAEWCGPCKQLGPALEEISEEMGDRIKIAKIDVDANQARATELGVRGVPSLFIFKGGELVDNRTGAAPKASLQSWIESAI